MLLYGITLFNVQLLFHGPSKYNSEMLEKLHWETWIQAKLPESH